MQELNSGARLASMIACTAVAAAWIAGCSADGLDTTTVAPDAIEVVGFSSSSASPGFWSHWGDGKAELNGYDLVQPRYGELRKGRAVLVYVTEPFSKRDFVKVNDWDRSDPAQVQVLKLNFIKKFQTGVYDYSVMTSIFVDPAERFAPVKTTFSMQEWCGSVYEETVFEGGEAKISAHSYFEGETANYALAMDGNVVAEDTLKITLRGLGAETLEQPEGELRLLPSSIERRFRHVKPTIVPSAVSWAPEAKTVEVPAGRFEVREASYARQDGARCTTQIEVSYPHRVVGWSCTDGEEAKLRGSARIPYWQTHNEGDEKLLGELGLEALQF